ncbi:tRNA preQ1(34) S-adenosylmethionine ribosyltransferase-isomerase QueA [Thermopirellula anaerolimosa]
MTDLSAYDYTLPKHLIAQNPLPNRADARLMVVRRRTDEIEHYHVRDLPELLNEGDVLVLNDTRVIPARLVGYRTETGGRWEGLFLESDGTGIWRVLAHTRGKPQPGETIRLINAQGEEDTLLRLVAKLPAGSGEWLAIPDSDEDALALLDRVGRVPLPPYIRDGEMIETDRQHYQTVFARVPGAVAAPTAGLHFTKKLLDEIRRKGIGIEYVTLHVGLGTFQPIKQERIEQHRMHSEWGRVTTATAERLREAQSQGRRIIAVGTTVVRLLETAAADGELQPYSGETDLFIKPPYRFRAISAMMTNFHLPKTTLLVLVRTFGGDELIRRAYEEAVREEYRFYSYGDAMLIV